jgi:cell division topological specificity factor
MDMINRLWRKDPSSKRTAKDRLKIVLINDRVTNSSHMLDMLKRDIVNIVSNYMEISTDDLDVQITQSPVSDEMGDKVPVLYANIPIKSIRRFRGASDRQK